MDDENTEVAPYKPHPEDDRHFKPMNDLVDHFCKLIGVDAAAAKKQALLVVASPETRAKKPYWFTRYEKDKAYLHINAKPTLPDEKENPAESLLVSKKMVDEQLPASGPKQQYADELRIRADVAARLFCEMISRNQEIIGRHKLKGSEDRVVWIDKSHINVAKRQFEEIEKNQKNELNSLQGSLVFACALQSILDENPLFENAKVGFHSVELNDQKQHQLEMYALKNESQRNFIRKSLEAGGIQVTTARHNPLKLTLSIPPAPERVPALEKIKENIQPDIQKPPPPKRDPADIARENKYREFVLTGTAGIGPANFL